MWKIKKLKLSPGGGRGKSILDNNPYKVNYHQFFKNAELTDQLLSLVLTI